MPLHTTPTRKGTPREPVGYVHQLDTVPGTQMETYPLQPSFHYPNRLSRVSAVCQGLLGYRVLSPSAHLREREYYLMGTLS